MKNTAQLNSSQFKLHMYFESIVADFCRILSTVFPNLEELYVEFDGYYHDEDWQPNIEPVAGIFYCEPFHPTHGVIPHLGMFSKLRKHEISAIGTTDFEDDESDGDNVEDDY